MMDELKQQFYEVMHKYQKPFSEEGVTANLTQWNEQKQGLLQLLRRHPLWNEKELAIVFRVEERREIDRITVDETRAAILELGRQGLPGSTLCTKTLMPRSTRQPQTMPGYQTSTDWTRFGSTAVSSAHRGKRQAVSSIGSA